MSDMNNDMMISVRGLRKQYRRGKINGQTLQQAIRERHERKKSQERGMAELPSQDAFYALDGIDLDVHRGESLGIIGKNGAGKSTLLKILSRITAPTEGTVDLYGRVTSMLEVGVGFHGDMTGRENIYLNGAILGMSRAEINRKMDEIIRFSEIEEFIDTPIKRYSSGMFVKLGFSVATHLDSEIVIMDEVLAVGDADFQKKCINRLSRSVKEQGKTVLFISHHMESIRRLCDRCIVMDKGKIVFDGDVGKAIAVYLGTDGELPAGIEFGPENRPYDAVIRPVIRFTIQRLRFVSHNTPVFYSGENVVMELVCTAEEKLDRVAFRFELWYQDGTKAATALSGNFLSLEKGEHRIQAVFPLQHLVPGQYTTDIFAFQFDDRGNEYRIDSVTPGFAFRILPPSDGSQYVNWQDQFWGAVRLHDIKLKVADT